MIFSNHKGGHMSIFITGGTGTTGRDTIKALQKRGATIRVGARDLAKAKALAGPGTDFVQFDYEKPETFIPAMKGCHTMLLLTGFDLIVIGLIWHEYRLIRRHLPRT